MKRVLYLAYFFPPLGGAGVQRTLKFVRYLPEFGWEATVLTGPAAYWLRDPSLLAEVPEGAAVVRSPHWGARFLGGGGGSTRRSASRLHGLRAASRTLLVPDAYVGWSWPALHTASRLVRADNFDAVVTTSSPDSAHLAGQVLARRGLPWIADFRDPWTHRLSYAPPTPLHDALHRRLERGVLRRADRIVVTSEATREDFLRLVPGVPPGKIVTITNGYDAEDFAAAEAWLAAEVASGRGPLGPLEDCPVLHAGQLNPERPLDAYLSGLRLFLERSGAEEGARPESAVRGEREGGAGRVSSGYDRAAEVRTLFLGGHYDRDLDRVQAAGLSDVVRFAASRPHLESVAALLRARVLLLLEQDSPRGGLVLPGKIFEYLRAGRPILAVAPVEGAAARLVRSLDAGWVADPKRPETIAEGLERLLGGVSSSSVPSKPGDRSGTSVGEDRVPSAVRVFERRALTHRLAALLDEVVG